MFGENVRCVFCARYFAQLEISRAQAILDPQISCGEMPDAAEASPATDAHSRGGICLDLECPGEAEIFGQSLQTQ